MRRTPDSLANALLQLDATARRRTRAIVTGFGCNADGAPTVLLGDCALRNFSSNDYLGLKHHPDLAAATAQAAREFGSGSGAAHLVCGHSIHHHALEEELADFLGRERALVFSTGYMANLGVISALTQRGECILADRLNHASLTDGARLSAARLRRYAHNDATAAALLLSSQPNVSLLATDGVFSMDGDIAPLLRLAGLCRTHQCWMLVDDAHGIGVLGAHGAGSLEVAGLSAGEVPLLVGTLGKALGSFGAFVAGDAPLIEYVMQHARSYIYTTALPPAVAAASRAALKVVRAEPWRRHQLAAMTSRFRAGAAALLASHHDVALLESSTPIQPLVVADETRALHLAAALRTRGFWVGAIRPPTVPVGTSRLRITLSAAQSDADIDALLEALDQSLRELAPVPA